MSLMPLKTTGYDDIVQKYPELRKLIDAYNENFRRIYMTYLQDAALIPGAGMTDLFRYRQIGLYYGSAIVAQDLGSFTATANSLDVTMFSVPVAQNFDRMAVNVQTGVAGSSCRMGVYSAGSTFYPGSLVLDAGAVDTVTAGVREVTVNMKLSPGLYWLALLFSHTPTMSGFNPATMPGVGISAADSLTVASAWRSAVTFGPMPATYPAGASLISGGRPSLLLRRSV